MVFAALRWTATAYAAGTLFGLTLLTFDGCLGRVPDVPGRPKRRGNWPSASGLLAGKATRLELRHADSAGSSVPGEGWLVGKAISGAVAVWEFAG